MLFCLHVVVNNLTIVCLQKEIDLPQRVCEKILEKTESYKYDYTYPKTNYLTIVLRVKSK